MGETVVVDDLLPADLRARYEEWMSPALQQAVLAQKHGDVPVGAVVLSAEGQLLGLGHNRREVDGDPLAHAEVLALRAAALTRGAWRLDDCSLVVTLEPCLMCAGALLQARVQRLVLGAWDERAGACGSVWDPVRDARSLHRVEVIGGVRAEECSDLLGNFFRSRRG